jgi:NAD(P)-dependent dehydrogenase (short-subunit alcohol dehydrogenase family)
MLSNPKCLELSRRGAHIIMACRDTKKAEKAADEIKKQTLNQQIDVEYLDLADLDSIRSFGRLMNQKLTKLDILINNAGRFLF